MNYTNKRGNKNVNKYFKRVKKKVFKYTKTCCQIQVILFVGDKDYGQKKI